MEWIDWNHCANILCVRMLNYSNRYNFIIAMKAANLAEYLSQVFHCTRKLDYCRQIMGENIHFLPEFIFNCCSETYMKELTVVQFANVLIKMGLKLPEDQIAALFDFIDRRRINKLSIKDFVMATLPLHNQTLIKVVEKRRLSEMELSFSLKYAFQKFVTQLLANCRVIEAFPKHEFQDLTIKDQRARETNGTNLQAFVEDSLQKFMLSQGKYFTKQELFTLIREIATRDIYSINFQRLKIFIASKVSTQPNLSESIFEQAITEHQRASGRKAHLDESVYSSPYSATKQTQKHSRVYSQLDVHSNQNQENKNLNQESEIKLSAYSKQKTINSTFSQKKSCNSSIMYPKKGREQTQKQEKSQLGSSGMKSEVKSNTVKSKSKLLEQSLDMSQEVSHISSNSKCEHSQKSNSRVKYHKEMPYYPRKG